MFVGFEPISSLSFKRALPYSPQTRGPVAYGNSYFMKITALLGALAYLGWLKDENCAKKGTLNEPFKGVRSCLGKIGVKDLKGPFALSGDLYFGEERLYPLSEVIRLWKSLRENGWLKDILSGELVLPRKKKSIWEVFHNKEQDFARKAIAYGIALERNKKTVKEGYLYIKERVFFNKRILMGFFANGNINLSFPEAITLGRHGVVKVVTEDTKETIGEGKGTEGALIFTSPALLAKPSSDYSEITLETVKEMVEEGLNCKIEKLEPFPLLRRFEIDLYPLGWDLVKDVQRPHVPAVLPGSSLYLKCEKPLEAGLYGLGQCSDLGFGTALFLP